MSLRLATSVFWAASLGGSAFLSGQNFAPPDSVLRAEDSPWARAENLIFYDSPRGPQLAPGPEPARTVSVEQLQHPVSRKGVKMLDQARRFSVAGLHARAIAQLQLALKERSAAPYAHSMLGGEYIKTLRIPEAIAELEQALTLLPRNVPSRSNLGYALFLSGDLERAEAETRQALDLDRSNLTTQFVLNQILHVRRLQASAQP